MRESGKRGDWRRGKKKIMKNVLSDFGKGPLKHSVSIKKLIVALIISQLKLLNHDISDVGQPLTSPAGIIY